MADTVNQPDDPGQQVIREVHHYHSGGEHRMGFGRLVDSLIPAFLLGFGAIVWMLSNSVTKLTEQVSNQGQNTAAEIAELKSDIAELRGEVRTSKQ